VLRKVRVINGSVDDRMPERKDDASDEDSVQGYEIQLDE